jgi:opacity protein-like surface antigen
MVPGFRRVLVLAGIVLLALACSQAEGQDGAWPAGRGTYVGVFGGAGIQDIDSVAQIGTAFYPPAEGGPLYVNAVADPGSRVVGIAGLHVGHEWCGSCLGCAGRSWTLLPAAEFEGFYLTSTQRADVSDPNNRLNGHVFADDFPLDSGVLLTNAIISLQAGGQRVTPYVGAGVGVACVSINGADSPQVIPPEPGVNHFNSNPDSSSWGFAAQAKAGVRFCVSERCYLFTEYRLLYVGSTDFSFGSTDYPTHVPTTPWTVNFGDTYHHLGVAGVGFHF